MAVYKNTFEGGSDGTPISRANSGGASGTSLTVLIANGIDVSTSTSPNIIFSSAAAQAGALGCRMTLDAGTSYLLINAPAAMTDRVYFRFKATFPGPSNNSGVPNPMGLLLANGGSNRVAYINVNSAGAAFLGVTNSNKWLAGGADPDTRSPALTAGQKYTFIVVVGKASAAGALDGELGFRILDSGGNIVHNWTGTHDTGVADFNGARFGTATNAAGWTTFDVDDVELGDIASGWPEGSGEASIVVTTNPYLVADFTGSTSGSGNTLSFSIAFTSGDNQSSGIKQPMSGLFLIPRGSSDSVYTVTVTDGAATSTQTVNVPAEGSAAVGEGVVEYYWNGTTWV